MKILLQTHNRPLVWISLYYILGIIGGYIWQKQLYMLLLFILCVAILGVCLGSYLYKSIYWILLIVPLVLGCVSYQTHPVVKEKDWIRKDTQIKGRIIEEKETTYGMQYVLADVVLLQNTQQQKLVSKIQLITTKNKVQLGDCIVFEGELIENQVQMNPSDFDYGQYLKGEGIGATVKGVSIEKIGHYQSIFEKSRKHLVNRIDDIFGKDKANVIKGLLLAEKIEDTHIRDVYFELGIGHLLVISGLHIGIIYGGIWWLLGKLKVTYRSRCMACLACIWMYVLLIGSGTSSVRAALFISSILLSRMINQEVDEWISLAASALLMLLINPYQLFLVSFQLSYLAFLGIILSGICIRKFEKMRWDKVALKGIKVIGCTLVITLLIWPVLAWHFYKIPLLGTVLNLIYVPLFSALIPAAIGIVILSYISLPLAQLLGLSIVSLLDVSHQFAYLFNQVPFVTQVVGRPSFLSVLIYYTLMICLYLRWIKEQVLISKKTLETCILCTLVGLLINVDLNHQLEVMHLYVGQGDATVIITPNQSVIVIDAGKVGKEETVWRYLQYKGYNKIDCLILSHPHDDHIGGAIELIKQKKLVDTVILSEEFKEEPLGQDFIEACKLSDTSYFSVKGEKNISLDNVQIDLLANQLRDKDANNNSLVVRVGYGNYTQLFTGDIEEERERTNLGIEGAITVLKVAHHGSKTSTSEYFLERIKPKYGMISCGIDNRYNHPSEEVVERLEQNDVETHITAEDGAVLFKTDGKTMQVVTQLQEAINGNTGD